MPKATSAIDGKKVQVNVRLPRELVQAIDEAVRDRGGLTDRTSLITEVLLEAFGATMEKPTSIIERVEALEAKLQEVQARLMGMQNSDSQTGESKTPDSASDRGKAPLLTNWYTPKEAFKVLGGNTDDSASEVFTLDGKRPVTLNRFLRGRGGYEAFGFKADFNRKDQRRPWLTPMPKLMARLTAQHEAGKS